VVEQAGEILLWLALAALLAGFVDAVVGGGGLVQIPALFMLRPELSPATLFGTNKLAAVCGTSLAAWRYARHVEMPWRAALPAALAAALASFGGAAALAWLPPVVLRPLLLLLLVFALVQVARRKDFGSQHRPRQGVAKAILLGAAIGFYDGFFGPGTGSFLILLFIRFFGFDFLHASAAAKVVNVATNLAALAYFVPAGHLIPLAAAVMAAGNVGGALAGSRLALRHGNRFVRQIFLLVVAALILRFAWDTLRGW
jgi:uncharacterized membrane protein YfcA